MDNSEIINDSHLVDVTPSPVSRLQFERETAERALRGESPPPCRICEILLSWFLHPPRVRKRKDSDEDAQSSLLERGDSDADIDSFPPRGKQYQVMYLGTFDEAIASPCSQHTAILKYLQQYSGHDVPPSGPMTLRYDWAGVGLLGTTRQKHLRDRMDLLLAVNPKNARKKHCAYMRMLQQKWVDLPVISQWMDACFKSHGEQCENPMNIARVVPNLLVDVKRKCIVDGTEDLRYVALSYRLGDAASFRLRLRDLEVLRKPAALGNAQILEMLPSTVCHAILLADELGCDYLWTDVLCIVHDGTESLSNQLNKMSAIYATAAMTIVATDGDGLVGILGLNGISAPRDLPQTAFPICDEFLMVRRDMEESVDATNGTLAYNHRGWTFQEYIMSSRKLLFIHHQAYWTCQCSQRRETDPTWVNRVGDVVFDPSQFIRSGYPDLGRLSNLLSWYNVRDLTYPGDALYAISGLLVVLSRGFEGGFLYGIPERFFDVVLGWQPKSYTEDSVWWNASWTSACRPRRGSQYECKPWDKTPNGLELPSWSWTAWQGNFVFGLHEVAQVRRWPGYRDEIFCETSPITRWSTGSQPSNCNRRSIMSNWHIDRQNGEDEDRPLPEGWTREKANFSLQGPFWRSIIYQHRSSEHEKPTFWYYPFRMPKINESTPFNVPEQTRYLFCKTWKASVLLCDRRDRQRTWKDALHMELWADELEFGERRPRTGRLWLHYEEQFEEETCAVTNSDGRMAFIDVVAISQCSFSGIHMHSDEDVDGEPWPLKDRINILWVKWEQGVAYRVASGYVYGEYWWRLEPEEIDLVLSAFVV